jgi:hypothetical protein
MGELSGRDAGCERARVWGALELDGELSEVERQLLLAHVGRCSTCAQTLEEQRAMTHLMRGAKLERPKRTFVVPAGPRRRRVARPAVAFAVVIAAGALGAFASSWRSEPSPQAPRSGDLAFLTDQRDFRDMRRPDLKPPVERLSPPGRLGAI